jgi:hypothetical protein
MGKWGAVIGPVAVGRRLVGVGDRPGNGQQLIQAVLLQGDLQGRPVGVLVVADLELEGDKQAPQGGLGRALEGDRSDRQGVQQLNRAGVGGLLLVVEGGQVAGGGVALALEFGEPPVDLGERDSAATVVVQRGIQL